MQQQTGAVRTSAGLPTPTKKDNHGQNTAAAPLVQENRMGAFHPDGPLRAADGNRRIQRRPFVPAARSGCAGRVARPSVQQHRTVRHSARSALHHMFARAHRGRVHRPHPPQRAAGGALRNLRPHADNRPRALRLRISLLHDFQPLPAARTLSHHRAAAAVEVQTGGPT